MKNQMKVIALLVAVSASPVLAEPKLRTAPLVSHAYTSDYRLVNVQDGLIMSKNVPMFVTYLDSKVASCTKTDDAVKHIKEAKKLPVVLGSTKDGQVICNETGLANPDIYRN